MLIYQASQTRRPDLAAVHIRAHPDAYDAAAPGQSAEIADASPEKSRRAAVYGRAQLRALKEGVLAKCRLRRNWYRFRMRPGYFRMRP